MYHRVFGKTSRTLVVSFTPEKKAFSQGSLCFWLFVVFFQEMLYCHWKSGTHLPHPASPPPPTPCSLFFSVPNVEGNHDANIYCVCVQARGPVYT